MEREPWSCVSGTPPISHVELTLHLGDLHYEGVPLAVAAALESEARLDKYMESYEASLRGAWGIPKSDEPEDPSNTGPVEAASESTVRVVRFVTRPNGQQVPIDDEGWGLTTSGRRDLRYKEPIGPPLP